MEKNSRYFVIGLFVSVTLLALALFVVWLAGTHDTRNYQNYAIYFRDPVSGLKSGALVQYRGVDVGRVVEVKLSEQQNDLIKVYVEIDDTTPISHSSTASLATQGVTGLVFIDLTTKPGDTSPPQRVEGEPFAVINGKGTQLSKLFQDVPAITAQVLLLTEKLNTAFSEKNIESMNRTFANIETISQSTNALLNEENLANTSAAIKNLASTSENVDQLVARFNETADKIDTAVENLNGIVSDNKANIDKFTGSGLRQITETTAETKEMAKSLRKLADTLAQEPSRLLYQPNYRGVEVQK